PAKLELARACGATEVVDASAGDPVGAVKECTGGRGADYVFEVVGRSETIRSAFAMTRRAGTCTIVGAGRFDDPVAFGAMALMVEAKTVRGCVYGATDPQRDFPAMVALAKAGRLDLEVLVSRRVGLDDLAEAFRAMAAGEGARSVVVY
ncbi:MAG: zinc-binding dehydrogenase, partial [Actinomycetota bacterium]